MFNQVLEEDKALRDLQTQRGMVGLALTWAIDHLEACLSPALMSSDLDHPSTSFKEDLDSLVAAPLTHALHLVGANFDKLPSKG